MMGEGDNNKRKKEEVSNDRGEVNLCARVHFEILFLFTHVVSTFIFVHHNIIFMHCREV